MNIYEWICERIKTELEEYDLTPISLGDMEGMTLSELYELIHNQQQIIWNIMEYIQQGYVEENEILKDILRRLYNDSTT